MSVTVRIDSLPEAIGLDQAVATAYRADLDWIEARLRSRLSVRVVADKQLALHLFRQLRQRLAVPHLGEAFTFAVVDGRPPTPDRDDAQPARALSARPSGVLGNTLANLAEQLFAYDRRKILALPHLDLLATTTRAGLTLETRETAALLYENPNALLLGFADPSFELPKVIEAAFPFTRTIAGMPRDRLPELITRAEARKFAVTEFNPFELYTYTSGLNAVRFREVLRHFDRAPDFDPRVHRVADRYRELRELTVTADFVLPDVRLDRDVAGYPAVKRELRRELLDLIEARDRLDDRAAIERLERLVPRGIILHGPPGTGKTLLAKALATEMNATAIVVSGPELKSLWVGETEANVRRIFATARRAAPSLIVFEEMDAIAPARDRGVTHEVTHATVNQILTELDGFRSDELVFVVATTNFVEALDSALLRPGRFELQILVGNPGDLDRRAILELYRERLDLALSDAQIARLVTRTRGLANQIAGQRFTGDHLYAIAKALKRDTLRAGGGPVTPAMLDRALLRYRGERPAPTPEERAVIATHEAGHAVLQELLEHTTPLERLSLTGDDEFAEARFFMKPMDAVNELVFTEAEARDTIGTFFGGRVAEELFFASPSAGCADDLAAATRIARNLVMYFGMDPERALWRSFWAERGEPAASPEALARADRAVDAVLEAEYRRARAVLTEQRALLGTLRDLLLQRGELTRDEIAALLPGSANAKAERYAERKADADNARQSATD